MTFAELSFATAPMDRVQFETLLSDISAQLIATNPEQVQETIELALDARPAVLRCRSMRIAFCQRHVRRRKCHLCFVWLWHRARSSRGEFGQDSVLALV
jgi:hypothetical protein